MLIIATLYVVLLWLLFSKLKLVRWGWFSGTLAMLGGPFILAVVPHGVGQGQVAVSGMLARVGSIGGAPTPIRRKSRFRTAWIAIGCASACRERRLFSRRMLASSGS